MTDLTPRTPSLKGKGEQEAQLAKDLARAETAALRELMSWLGDPPDINRVPNSFWTDLAQTYNKILTTNLQGTLLGELQRFVDVRQPAPEWSLLVQDGNQWSMDYISKLAQEMAMNSRRIVGEIAQDSAESGLNPGQVMERLAWRLGPVHAELVAITETTRANAQAAAIIQERVGEMGVQTVLRWLTSEDEKVCAICGPLDHQVRGEGWTDIPPAHPKCRCEVVVENVSVG